MAWRRKSQTILRISVDQKPEEAVIALEGRIAGPWVAELKRVWAGLAQSLKARKLLIDLRNTTYADASGIQALREIHSQTAAQFVTSTPWTEYLAEEVTR
jgi:anti-anti-sigma regulatory factor